MCVCVCVCVRPITEAEPITLEILDVGIKWFPTFTYVQVRFVNTPETRHQKDGLEKKAGTEMWSVLRTNWFFAYHSFRPGVNFCP